MSRRTPTAEDLRCWKCGEVLPTRLAWSVHVSTCDAPSSPITRPVSCGACAGQIDLRQGPTCPDCGTVYPIERRGAAPRGDGSPAVSSAG